jgi:ABC-2 type transport system ATP-binding protein
VDDLVARAQGAVRVRSPQHGELARILAGEAAEVERIEDDALRVTGADRERIGHLAAEHGLVITELYSVQANLEDVFLQLTGDSAETPS